MTHDRSSLVLRGTALVAANIEPKGHHSHSRRSWYARGRYNCAARTDEANRPQRRTSLRRAYRGLRVLTGRLWMS